MVHPPGAARSKVRHRRRTANSGSRLIRDARQSGRHTFMRCRRDIPGRGAPLDESLESTSARVDWRSPDASGPNLACMRTVSPSRQAHAMKDVATVQFALDLHGAMGGSIC